MSALNSTGLREHSHPYLEELRQRTSYTFNLSVLDGSDILYVDRARSFRQGQARLIPACTRIAVAGVLHIDGEDPARVSPRRGAA